jgi:hypothetical protein
LLVTGGFNVASFSLNSAELYDPSTGMWTTTYNMNYRRQGPTASVLNDGKVLITAGWSGSATLNSAELYEPGIETWAIADSINNDKRLVSSKKNGNQNLNNTKLH